MKITELKKIPEVTDIGDGIKKIILPQPFYAPNNVYMLLDEEPTLIDSGYIESVPMLQAGLKKIGMSLRDIRKIIYTHNHIDHISAALVLKSYSPKAVFYGIKGMAEGIGNYIESVDLFRIASIEMFTKAYKDPKQKKEVIDKYDEYWKNFFARFKETRKGDPILKIDVGVESGDVIECGSVKINIMHTPGHNLYHITPFIKKTGVYFSGDLIIANLTAIYSEFDGDLDDYRLTLDRLSEEPIRRMLPAHGEEIENPQRQIVLVRKTLDILERGILRRLGETDSDLFTLMEAAIGKKVHSGGHLATALGLIYAIIKKLEKRHLVSIFSRDDGYETFSLAK